MGAFCCHVHQSFDPICLKTLCSLSPPPVMLHIKFDQDWPTDLRDIQVRKCKIFVIQGQVTPKRVVWSGPKSNSSKLLCLSWLQATLMMIRSKMNELAWRQHFPITCISLWKFFRRSRVANSVVSSPIWPKFKVVRFPLYWLEKGGWSGIGRVYFPSWWKCDLLLQTAVWLLSKNLLFIWVEFWFPSTVFVSQVKVAS